MLSLKGLTTMLQALIRYPSPAHSSTDNIAALLVMNYQLTNLAWGCYGRAMP